MCPYGVKSTAVHKLQQNTAVFEKTTAHKAHTMVQYCRLIYPPEEQLRFKKSKEVIAAWGEWKWL